MAHAGDDHEQLAGALSVLYKWKPLLEAGLASHVTRICAHCAREQLLGIAEQVPDYDQLRNDIERKLSSKATCSVERFGKDVYIRVEGSARYLHDRVAIRHIQGPAKKPLLKILGRRRAATVTPEVAWATSAFRSLADPIISEAVLQQFHRNSVSPHAHYASNLPVDLELAGGLSASGQWPRGVLNALGHAVPVLGNVPIADIVQFRLENVPAFLRYRQRIRSVAEHAHDPQRLIEAAAELKSDYAALEQSLRSARAGLVRKARNELLLIGSIGLGIAGSIGPQFMLPLLGVAARSLAEAVRPVASDEIAKQPLYFLWQIAKRRRR